MSEKPSEASDPDEALETSEAPSVPVGLTARTGAEIRRDDDIAFRKRLSTVFGWIAGGSLGLLLNYALFLIVSDEAGQGYPTVPTTFTLFVAGAFGGMAISDRGGEKAFKPLGIAAGILLALFLALVAAVLMSPPTTP